MNVKSLTSSLPSPPSTKPRSFWLNYPANFLPKGVRFPNKTGSELKLYDFIWFLKNWGDHKNKLFTKENY
jgi:hypothetical protein